MDLWFVTPVYKRFHLAKVCLEQRRRLIEKLPFDAHCVVVGDDETAEYGRELGFHVVECDNEFVGRKWNRGYKYAHENGATHVMPIGSDSFVHEKMFEPIEWADHKGYAGVGLSSFAPDGSERVDLRVRYPAGFGVGMIYASEYTYAKRLRHNACDPHRQRGCDNSTWNRVGRGNMPLNFLEYQPYVYLNFHSYEESITNFNLVKRTSGRVIGRQEGGDILQPIRDLYDADLLDELQTLWALRSLQTFLHEPQTFFNPHQGRSRRGYPAVANRGTTGGLRSGQFVRTYPKVGMRKQSSVAKMQKIQRQKESGLPLTRDEEIMLRFRDAREA